MNNCHDLSAFHPDEETLQPAVSDTQQSGSHVKNNLTNHRLTFGAHGA